MAPSGGAATATVMFDEDDDDDDHFVVEEKKLAPDPVGREGVWTGGGGKKTVCER